jgi:branched-chain amino acid transport system permease protein
VKFSTKLALAGVGIALLASVPWWGSAVVVQFGINALILATLAQSWNIIGG